MLLPRRSEVVWALSLASPVAGLIVGFGLLSEPSVYLVALIAVSVLPVVAVVLAHAEAKHSSGASVLGPAYIAVMIFCGYWLLLLAVAAGDPTEFARDNASMFDGDGAT